MDNYNVVNILDMIESLGEKRVVDVLQQFSCAKNLEIEKFVKNNAIDFAKKKISITYLVVDGFLNIISMFVLTHKALSIRDVNISSTAKKKISRYAEYDEINCSYNLSAFLIAQFGKNYNCLNNEQFDGHCLMGETFAILKNVQKEIGGGIVYLECENKPKLLYFYCDEHNSFKIFGERTSKKEGILYMQLLKIF